MPHGGHGHGHSGRSGGRSSAKGAKKSAKGKGSKSQSKKKPPTTIPITRPTGSKMSKKRPDHVKEVQKAYEEHHDKLLEDDYEVAKKKIDWDKVSNQYASKDDILLLRQLEASDDDLLAPMGDITALFLDKETSSKIARAFLRILDTKSNEILTYILTLLSHILTDDPSRGQVFLDNHSESKEDKSIVESFRAVWLRHDSSAFVRGKAAICASNILRWGNKDNIHAFKSIQTWLFGEFSLKNDALLAPLYALKGIIGNEYFQEMFVLDDGIGRLTKMLEINKQHHQVVYLVSYCLWVITFKKKYKPKVVNESTIRKLSKIVKTKLSLKVTRVILALFENLLGVNKFNEMVVLFEIYDFLLNMHENEKIEDEEMKKSILNLLEHLEKSVKILSSFERYEQEIKFKTLKWGPCHTENFFKKYSQKFENDNFRLIRSVIECLDSDENDVVAIACYDIGLWAKYYADAKFILDKLKGKFKLMSLIDHVDERVRKEALIAVQSVLIKQHTIDDESKNDK